ncbi:MAG: hypothetical protein LBC85_09240 [Fibromonadaceae bacterium]|jgi:hypothetical protein|nr:hypothetical protein [Fibromonadaceae bacterium]
MIALSKYFKEGFQGVNNKSEFMSGDYAINLLTIMEIKNGPSQRKNS